MSNIFTKSNWRTEIKKERAAVGLEYADSKFNGKEYYQCSQEGYFEFYDDGVEYPYCVAYRDDTEKLYGLYYEWNPDEDAREEGETMVADWYEDVFAAEPITDDVDETCDWLNCEYNRY